METNTVTMSATAYNGLISQLNDLTSLATAIHNLLLSCAKLKVVSKTVLGKEVKLIDTLPEVLHYSSVHTKLLRELLPGVNPEVSARWYMASVKSRFIKKVDRDVVTSVTISMSEYNQYLNFSSEVFYKNECELEAIKSKLTELHESLNRHEFF